MIDLYSEFTAATALAEPRHFRWLVNRGVPPDFLWRGAMRLGVQDIAPSNDGTYQPIDEGQRAIIMPTIPLLAPWEWEEGDDLEDVGDLTAFRPDDPSRWWCRCGSVPILNPAAILGAELYDEPLRIHSTPLDWMRAAGDGVVILDPLAHLGLHLGSVRQLICDTVELGREIDRRLRHPEPKMPTIMIPNVVRAAA